jgi:hypothetical protein
MKNCQKFCSRFYRQDRPLSTWISNQRAARNNNALTPEQITKLDAIGFIWNPKKGKKILNTLLTFKDLVEIPLPKKLKTMKSGTSTSLN